MFMITQEGSAVCADFVKIIHASSGNRCINLDLGDARITFLELEKSDKDKCNKIIEKLAHKIELREDEIIYCKDFLEE